MRTRWIAMVLIGIVFMALFAFCGGARSLAEPTMQEDAVVHVGIDQGHGVFLPRGCEVPDQIPCLDYVVTNDKAAVITCFGDRPDGLQTQRVDDGLQHYENENLEAVLLWRTALFAEAPLHRWICA